VQEKKVWVFELIPIDLINKVEEISMTNLPILYNINLVPFVCAMLAAVNVEQQRLGVEEEL
jgi:hypothetical protein